MTGTTFRHHLLTLDEESTPFVVRQEAPLQPGQPSPVRSADPVLIAGGFPSISPDSAYPLSPTLQVNGDLTTCDDHLLTAIALAELERHNNAHWRTTTREADNTVCVLAADAGRLHRFIDTYGGVLAIRPLLASGCDPDFATASELTVTPADDNLRLDFLVRVPVDRQRCTYCGACGPVCPRDCLSPTLFLDLETCDFCNECVRACPHGAIDLHGARRQRLEVPALLLLDQVNIDLPTESEPGRGRIFRPEQLEQLFASIYPCQVEELLTCDNRLCQYSVRTGRGCTLCLSVCPHHAVTVDGSGIRIDQERCLECGLCASTCPTGAIQYHRFDDRTFLGWLSAVAPGSATTLVLAEAADLHHFWWRNRGRSFSHTLFLEFPRLQALHLMHLLAALGRGFSRILLLGHGQARPGQQAMDQANRIYSQLDGPGEPVRLVTAGELASLLEEEAPAAPALPADIDTSSNRRTILASLLARLGEAASRPLVLAGVDFPEFGSLRCDPDRCTLCLACLNDCRIGALRADREQLLLQHAPLSCVQCGACCATCPEDALALAPGLEIGPDRPGITDLARAEPMLCRQCGKMFGTRQSHERVLVLLRQKNLVQDDELYEYCETCRVVRIYGGGDDDY